MVNISPQSERAGIFLETASDLEKGFGLKLSRNAACVARVEGRLSRAEHSATKRDP